MVIFHYGNLCLFFHCMVLFYVSNIFYCRPGNYQIYFFSFAKEMPPVSFLDFYRTTTLPDSFCLIRCYEATFVKKCNKPLLQVSETKILEQKRLMNFFFQSQPEKLFGRYENKSGNV